MSYLNPTNTIGIYNVPFAHRTFRKKFLLKKSADYRLFIININEMIAFVRFQIFGNWTTKKNIPEFFSPNCQQRFS